MASHLDIYKPCDHIKRTEPDSTVDQELIKRIAEDYRTLPSFENTSFQHKIVKHYSLQTNELLKCRWKKYRDNIEKKVFAPFQFPNVRDLHFYNGAIRFSPELTIRNKDMRMKMGVGPGVDYKGQMPIPNELYMKRGVAKKEENGRIVKKIIKKEIVNNVKKDVPKEGKKDAKKEVKKTLKKDTVKDIKKDIKKDLKIEENEESKALKKDNNKKT